MKREYELILRTVLINKNIKESDYLTLLLKEKMDWCEIAGQLFNHRLAGYFFLGLTNQQREKIPKELRKAMELLVVAQKNQIYNTISELKTVLSDFKEHNLNYAGLKGIVFNVDMYEKGLRRSNDVDLLVAENELGKLDSILRKNGYIQSFLPNGQFIEATKREKMIQRMNYHDLVPYVKKINNSVIEIDINFQFDTKENEITQKIFEYGVFEYKDKDYLVMGLPFYTNLAFLCIHFFREGTNSIWTDGKRDVVLYKLVDIMNLIRKNRDDFDVYEWVRLMNKLKIAHKCYYTLYMLSLFYPEEELLKVLMNLLEPSDKSYLFEVKIEGENKTVKRNESFFDSAFNHIR